MSEEKRVATVFDLTRMCKSFGVKCEGCPLVVGGCCHPFDFTDRDSDAIIEWCDEHPQKTYAQDFFEKFPKADICRGENEKEYPNGVCRNRIFGLETECGWCFKHSCSNCWNEIMPEATE